jgi:bifunctional DNA-binding transcriptional regulator/antitoxin component of YhaV-PrlF toxin-antitoxin module
MDTVVISASFDIRLPRRIRNALGLVPGQPLRVVQHGRRIELVPLRPAIEVPGLFGGDAGSSNLADKVS